MLLTYKENVHSTQMYIPLKPLFSRHKGIGVQFTDEPTGALDRRTTTNLVQLFQQMIQEEGISVVLVTHDPFVASFRNRVIFIQDGTITDELTLNTGRESFYQQIVIKL